MNPNKALWEKGDFTRIAATMRESGEALVKELGITSGLEVLDLGCGDGTTALPAARARRRRARASTSRATSSRPATARAESEGLTNCRFQEGDASDLHDLDDDTFDLVVSIFGAMFAPQAVRRRQGDGARDPARRPDRHGQLDPERPDAGRADPEDQRRVLAAAAGGLRQPDDVGRRERTSSSASPPPACPKRTISFDRDTYTFNFAGTPAELLADVPRRTTARR